MKQIPETLDKAASILLAVWLILLAILYSALSIIRHLHFQSGGFDLGIYDQSVWQYAHFLTPYSTIKERFILGDHFALTLPLLSPLFYIYDSVTMLLVFQSVWFCLSAIGVFFLAKKYVTPIVAFIISFSYSIFFGIQFTVFFDFHPVIIGVGLLPFIALSLERKKKKLLIFLVVLLLLTQENMGIALASLGFCYLFRKEYRSYALSFIVAGIMASLILLRVTASLSPIGYEYPPHISSSPVQVASDFFNTDEKRTVWYYSFGSFGFLPFLSPGSVLGAALDLSQYFVTGPALARMWSPFTHHRATLGPLLAIGTIQTFALLKQRKKHYYLAASLFVFSLIFQYINHFPLNKLTKSEFLHEEQWMRDDRELLGFVPRDASVAAQQNFVPHLSHRKEIYLVWPRQVANSDCPKGCWQLTFAGKPDYLVIDGRKDQWITQTLETNEHYQEALVNMKTAQKITPVKMVGDAALYKISY